MKTTTKVLKNKFVLAADPFTVAGNLFEFKEKSRNTSEIIMVTDCEPDNNECFSGVVINGGRLYDIGASDTRWAREDFQPFYGTVEITSENS